MPQQFWVFEKDGFGYEQLDFFTFLLRTEVIEKEQTLRKNTLKLVSCLKIVVLISDVFGIMLIDQWTGPLGRNSRGRNCTHGSMSRPLVVWTDCKSFSMLAFEVEIFEV